MRGPTVRIYAAARSETVKGSLYMIGFVIVADALMVWLLEHPLHRTVSIEAQWPIAVLILGVIAVGIRSFNHASRQWVEVTAKQLRWASGPRAAKSGFAPTGAVKLSELAAVSIELDEYPVKVGRRELTLRAHRLHAEVAGKPALVLPVVAEVPGETGPLLAGADQARLLRLIEQLNANAKNFTVDTEPLGVEVSAAEAEAEADVDVEVAEAYDAQDAGAEAAVETEEAEVDETEIPETEIHEVEVEQNEVVAEPALVAKAEISD
jgi:hypothetical protein